MVGRDFVEPMAPLWKSRGENKANGNYCVAESLIPGPTLVFFANRDDRHSVMRATR